jgi:hypothetical protein
MAFLPASYRNLAKRGNSGNKLIAAAMAGKISPEQAGIGAGLALLRGPTS